MTEQLFWQPGIGRRPRSASGIRIPESPVEQLALDWGEDGRVSAPAPVSRPAAPEPEAALDLAGFAEQNGYSGPRRDLVSHRAGVDVPDQALPQSRCRCDRPLPAVDPEGREVRCHKCGRRRQSEPR